MRATWQTVALLAVAALAGCSSGRQAVPAACLGPPGDFERALAAAPAPVRVSGVRISSCFARRSDTASLEDVGSTLVSVASGLSAAAAGSPSSRPAIELGYLIGAARRGSGRTEGIHYTLMRRLEQELSGVGASSPGLAAAVRAGERTG